MGKGPTQIGARNCWMHLGNQVMVVKTNVRKALLCRELVQQAAQRHEFLFKCHEVCVRLESPCQSRDITNTSSDDFLLISAHRKPEEFDAGVRSRFLLLVAQPKLHVFVQDDCRSRCLARNGRQPGQLKP